VEDEYDGWGGKGVDHEGLEGGGRCVGGDRFVHRFSEDKMEVPDLKDFECGEKPERRCEVSAGVEGQPNECELGDGWEGVRDADDLGEVRWPLVKWVGGVELESAEAGESVEGEGVGLSHGHCVGSITFW
jgi:hypothetical protein